MQFAQLLGQTLVANGYICNLGVAAGEVLLFELSEDAKDLAGGPVNVASKLAEDTHERQVIFCDDSVAEAARNLGITEAHTLVKSGVSLQALKQSL